MLFAALAATRLPTLLVSSSLLASRSPKAFATAARPPPENAIAIEPSGEHAASVIFLHGLGDSGHGWADIVPEIDRALPEAVRGKIRWLLPHAPKRPITLNGGFVMPGWADVYGLGDDDPEDGAGMAESAKMVEALVADEESAGIPASRIIVGGFSQGGAVALYHSLRTARPLAGCLTLSSWLTMRGDYPAKLGPHARTLPIFQGHGDSDMTVSLEWAQLSRRELETHGLQGIAPMVVAPGVGHGIDLFLVHKIAAWVGETLGAACRTDAEPHSKL